MPTKPKARSRETSAIDLPLSWDLDAAWRALRSWFTKHKRTLPWRREPRDPYHVWLSEVMLQQTQVATVVPYFERWLRNFPSLAALAQAPLNDVLKLWEGLGYYARARNFHRAVQQVVREHDGVIPSTVDGLQALPGVGRYTAGAIASLAYGAHAAVLDGNVKRVVSRLFAIDDPARDLWPTVEAMLPRGDAGAFNEAMMELGALICTPRAPDCAACPLQARCAAYASGAPERFPVKIQKARTPHHDVLTAVVVNTRGEVLLGQRPASGLLGGLWEFVSSDFRGALEFMPGADAVEAMVRERTGLDVSAQGVLGPIKHAFTHFKITRHVWLCKVRGSAAKLRVSGYVELRWVPPEGISALALTRSDLRVAALLALSRARVYSGT